MESLFKLRKCRDKPDTLLTVIIHNYIKSEFINYLLDQLKSIQNIKSSFKRKLLNDRIYNFKCYMEEKIEDEKLNYIFLVGDEIHNFKLEDEHINILNEYKIRNLYYKFDDRYKINYVQDLFFNFEFYQVLEIDNKHISKYKINKTKKKKLDDFKINNMDELISLCNNIDLIHGKSSYLKNFTLIRNYNQKLDDMEILEELDKITIERNHNKLKELIDNIKNPLYDGKIIFGGIETKKYTEMSMIKILFIHESIYKKFLRCYSDYINFEVIEIKKLENGDVSSFLKNDYSDCLGELYYSVT